MTLRSMRIPYENLVAVGYAIKVEKPLGVVFGENGDPYYGLVVDEVEEGMNGDDAGIRVGDQLLTINGESVVGDTLDVMTMLKDSPVQMELQLYRGNVRSLFVALNNMTPLVETRRREEEEIIIMDENYVSPVRVEVVEEKPLTAGDVFNAFKKIGTKLTESDAPPPEKKEKKGLFGGMFSGETIQLDGDDAKGLKRNPKK